MRFDVELLPPAWEHLQAFKVRERNIILDAIEQQLQHDPDQPTRNRKQLQSNPLATWELRVHTYRVFYDIALDEAKVRIVAIGRKERNRLFIGGKEFRLS